MTSDALSAEDAAARTRAQTVFDRPLLLGAGAGSGKTCVLVARVVAWCLGPGWERAQTVRSGSDGEMAPERVAARVLDGVVAITFTEAAAAEMERRVAETLRAIAAGGDLPTGVEAAALPEPAERRRTRAKALLGVLDRLFVRTIHGYCRRLLATHALEAGLHPRFVVDAQGIARAEVARETLEAFLHDVFAGTEDAEAEADLLALAVRGVGPLELEQALAAVLAAGVSPEALDVDPFAPERVSALADRVVDALSVLLEASAPLAEARRTPKALEVRETLGPLRAAVLAASGSATALRDAAAEGGQATSAKWNAWARAQFGVEERTLLADRAPALARAAARARRRLRHAARLEPELVGPARRVLARLAARAAPALRARGAVSYDELLRAGCALLATRPDVREAERRRIEQLLVDEFQDTDPLQCRIVEQLALDGPSDAGRPGLFVVGDPKQSIYGWRNADLAAYDRFAERLRKAGGECHRLVTCFRSLPAVLAEVERAIRPVMREEPGLQPAYEPLIPCAERLADGAPDEPAVEYWLSARFDAASREPVTTPVGEAAALEARALAADVRRRLDRGLSPAEVGILLRSTGDIDVYLAALRDAGIPYAVDRERGWGARREVIEAAALVRAVLDPNDQIALVATLRSAWVGVPDAAWIPLWEAGFPDSVRAALEGDRSALAHARHQGARVAAEIAGRAVPGLERVAGWEHSLAHALDVLVALRETLEAEPPERFVERLRALTLVEATESARYPGRFRLANLDRFLREFEASLELGATAEQRLRALRLGRIESPDAEAATPPGSVSDAVQVMTIHGAKGLGFEHVYLVQAHKGSPTKIADSGDPVFESVDGHLEARLFGGRTPAFDRVEERREAVNRAEELRTLYVAMTRAKRRLVIAGVWPDHGLRAAEAKRAGHVRWLANARGGALSAALARLRADPKSERVVDADGVAWVFPALAAKPEAAPAARRPRPSLPAASRVVEDARRLRALRVEAGRRAIRRFGGPASEKAHEALRERRVDEADGSVPPGAARARREEREGGIAAAVGTAVHRLLERFDPAASDLEAALAAERSRLFEELGRCVAASEREAALRRAGATLQAFVEGPLLPRLCELAPHVLARELPFLLPADPDGDGPVGFVAGRLDLLYRDPERGDVVVVDFKTDWVHAPQEVDARAQAYAAQGAVYARAVREGLGLAAPPRVELWFLVSGRVVEPS